MAIKILSLFGVLVILILIESRILRKRIRNYHPLTWGLIELFWYLISFAAVCIGLVELERIEKLNIYKQKEQALNQDYVNKKNLLHAQTWFLKLDKTLSPSEEDGVKWFHKMKGLFEEGIYTTRWEAFLAFTRSHVLKVP